MPKWSKLPALTEPSWNGCLCCPVKPLTLKMNWELAVGFGCIDLTKDGKTVWSGDGKAVMEFENIARGAPKHDWRIVVNGPLSGETYQRQGRSLWVLVDKNEGFA